MSPFLFLFTFIMANPAYDQALTTGKVVIRKWWFNTNSTKNQMSLQFQQAVEKPTSEVNVNSLLISMEQGTEPLGNTTNVTALRSINADKASVILGSREGDATMGSPVIEANAFYEKLGFPEGTEFAIQVTEDFEKNPYSKTQSPKINPSTGEVVVATNPVTGTQMPVYRHTELVIAETCNHTFIAGEAAKATATAEANAISISQGITS